MGTSHSTIVIVCRQILRWSRHQEQQCQRFSVVGWGRLAKVARRRWERSREKALRCTCVRRGYVGYRNSPHVYYQTTDSMDVVKSHPPTRSGGLANLAILLAQKLSPSLDSKVFLQKAKNRYWEGVSCSGPALEDHHTVSIDTNTTTRQWEWLHTIMNNHIAAFIRTTPIIQKGYNDHTHIGWPLS